MKTSIKFWTVFIIVQIFIALLLSSCKAKTPLQNTTIETNDKTTVLSEKEIIERNKEILDEIIFKIAQINSAKPECDSLINHYRKELAQSLAAYKKSGDNQYILGYNEATKQLEFKVKIAQTENKQSVKNIETKTTYTLQKTVEVPVKLPLSWWESFFYRVGQILSVIVVTYLFIKANSKFKIV